MKSPSGEWTQALHQIMNLFLDAADSYYKEKCFDKSNRCLNWSALVGLQLQIPGKILCST